MKTLRNFLKITCLITLISFALPSFAKEMPIYSNSGTTISVTPDNKYFQIVLPTTTGTGYVWTLSELPNQYINLKKFKQFHAQPGIPGAKAYDVWVFKVKNKALNEQADFIIRFIYERPWNHDIAHVASFHVKAQK